MNTRTTHSRPGGDGGPDGRDALRRLRRSEQRLRGLLDAVHAGVIVRRADGTLVHANRAAAELIGADRRPAEDPVRALASAPWRVVDADGRTLDRAQWPSEETFRTGAPVQDRLLGIEIEGRDEPRWLLASTRPLYDEPSGELREVLVAFHDVTAVRRAEAARQALERQLLQAQKMEAVGQLAGGVAHDFNNLLQAIQGCTDLALTQLGMLDPARDLLEEVRRATERATAVTRQLLTFSRREPLQLEPVDLNELLRNLLRMLRRLLGEYVRLEIALCEGPAPLHADPGQLEQLVVNLCVNARDAMPGGGAIRIATALVELSAADLAGTRAAAGPGPHVQLTVADDGPGIPAELQERVFEPFFTTKQVGQGTGLGLATVYATVERHHGRIELLSAPGAGAEFRVLLPACDQLAVESPASAAHAAAEGGCETILLAEDDEGARSLAARVLESAGYRLLVARDGREAEALVREHGAHIDLAVLDVVMPHRSGREVERALHGAGARTPVLFTSGYSFATLPQQQLPDGSELLQKPYAPGALLARVRRLLRRSARRSSERGPARDASDME